MVLSPEVFKNTWIKRLAPAAVVCVVLYIDFAVFYELGYREIYVHHSRAAAGVLWGLIGFFEISFFVYWTSIFVTGPGVPLRVAPMDIYGTHEEGLLRVPDWFLCDEGGFPFWCSSCQSIKVARFFHLKDAGRCVQKFDHYCVYLGAVIGRANYLYFFKTVLSVEAFLVVTMVYLIRYSRPNYIRNNRQLNPNYIVVYIIGGFWFLMILTITSVYTRYMLLNMTTVEDLSISQLRRFRRWKADYDRARENGKNTDVLMRRMPRKEKGLRYMNMKHGDTRIVVPFLAKERPFDLGFRKNFINLIFNKHQSTGPFAERKDSYSTATLLRAFLVFLVPFYDLVVFRTTAKIPAEYRADDQTQHEPALVAEFHDKFSESFLRRLDDVVERGQYTRAQYLIPAGSPGMETVPEGVLSSNTEK